MRIGITGASGFVGGHVIQAALAGGHTVTAFSRSGKVVPGATETRRYHPVAEADFRELDAIIHLAGESVLGLWTRRKKAAVRDSRVLDTCKMVDRLRALEERPRVLVSAGGISYYGDGGGEPLSETSASGEGVLAEVCRAWEAAVEDAAGIMRTVSLRIGVTLGQEGGSYPLLRRIFRLGLGGRLGSGRQFMPWIHIDDLARLFIHAVESPGLSGAVNAVGPEPLTNAEFTKTLASVLHRPALFPVPAFVLSRLPGGMGEIFLQSQRLRPDKAINSGFRFLHGTLRHALEDLDNSSK